MRKKIFFIIIILLTQSCIQFKENPLDPTSPTGMLIYSIPDNLSETSSKKIFITQQTVNGNIYGFSVPGSNAIQKADYICNNDPYKPFTSSSFKAMIVDNTNRRACATPNCTDPNENIDWVFKPNTDYYTHHGDLYLFTTNSAGIVPQTQNLANPIAPGVVDYWTGLGLDWTSSPTNCSNWAYGSSAYYGVIGRNNEISNGYWYSYFNTVPCDSSKSLLCVEQ